MPHVVYTECHCTECRYAECRGALKSYKTSSFSSSLKPRQNNLGCWSLNVTKQCSSSITLKKNKLVCLSLASFSGQSYTCEQVQTLPEWGTTLLTLDEKVRLTCKNLLWTNAPAYFVRHCKYLTILKKLDSDNHSSLFVPTVIDEEKSVNTLITNTLAYLIFSFHLKSSLK